MVKKASSNGGFSEQFFELGDSRQGDMYPVTRDGDHFVAEADMTDAEILLREWCGEV